MLDERTLREIVRVVTENARAELVILFGSQARGEAGPESDVDLLVVEAQVEDRLAEMARLREALWPLGLNVDLIVVSREKFEYWRDTPGTVYYEAAEDGKVLYEAA